MTDKYKGNETKLSFKDYLKRERQRQGMTQSDLAKDMRVSRQTVSHWEKGIRIPDVSTLEALAEVLHTKVYSLLGGEEADEESKQKGDLNYREIAKQLAQLNSQYAEIIWEKKRQWNIVLVISGLLTAIILTLFFVRIFIFHNLSANRIEPDQVIEETSKIKP